jgi:hypothetical protein
LSHVRLVIHAVAAYSYATFAQSGVVLVASASPADSHDCAAWSHFRARANATAVRSQAIASIWKAPRFSKSCAAVVQAPWSLSSLLAAM